MTSITGANPPLHRRFNERNSIRYIKNRYSQLREIIGKQVKALQGDDVFCAQVRSLYQKGYKDWVIVAIIFNRVLNWRAQELGLHPADPSYREWAKRVNVELKDVAYPASRFTTLDWDHEIEFHCVTALTTYGFEPRRMIFLAETVLKFMQQRLRHFEFDIPHQPLFGEPPGDWPKC